MVIQTNRINKISINHSMVNSHPSPRVWAVRPGMEIFPVRPVDPRVPVVIRVFQVARRKIIPKVTQVNRRGRPQVEQHHHGDSHRWDTLEWLDTHHTVIQGDHQEHNQVAQGHNQPVNLTLVNKVIYIILF